MYKNLNSQSALGRGYVGGSGGATLTGSTIGKGMCYGSISGLEQVKFLGVEDFWGNLRQWIDGFISTSDYHALVATDAFNSTGENYTDIGALSTKYIGGFMTKPYGSNDTGFVIGSAGGSDSTYFSDYADFNADSVPIFGGGFSDSSYAGAFRLGITYKLSSNGDMYVGGRLMYL